MRRVARAMLAALVLALLGAVVPGLPATAVAALEDRGDKERLEVDVSSRSVAVTSSFSGTEIVVFGTVEHSRQETAESGYYDVVVVLEGVMAPLVARKKSNFGGMWVNTTAVRFASLPSYYAIASTRPIDEIADEPVRDRYRIGFVHVPMQVAGRGIATGLSKEAYEEFRQAIVRLKKNDGLYVSSDYNVAFIGRSLFRAAVELPANIPVGEVKARVYLFRNGEMLSEASARVMLAREGIERYLYNFANQHPFFYGLFCAALAVAVGLVGSTLFRRNPR